MGFLKVFFYTFGSLSGGLFLSLRLGRNLEIASRLTGQKIGLYYKYIKVILFNLKPKSQEPGEIIRMVRNINQQSHAFSRELQQNMQNTKRDLDNFIPSLKSNYLEERKQQFSNLFSKIEESVANSNEKEQASSLEKQYKVENYLNSQNGVNIIEYSILERRKILNKKKQSQNTKSILFENENSKI